MQRNPKANAFRLPAGYRDLGWQLSGKEPELVSCRESKHKTHEFDNSIFMCRCSDVITICNECKTVYHTDMT